MMVVEKDVELTAHTSEVDEIAAQEAIEDERNKTQQNQSGGALEVWLQITKYYLLHKISAD